MTPRRCYFQPWWGFFLQILNAFHWQIPIAINRFHCSPRYRRMLDFSIFRYVSFRKRNKTISLLAPLPSLFDLIDLSIRFDSFRFVSRCFASLRFVNATKPFHCSSCYHRMFDFSIFLFGGERKQHSSTSTSNA